MSHNPFIHIDTVKHHENLSEKIATYQEAIRALELDERDEERFLDPNRWEFFRSDLAKRLNKVKLWNYAPDRREAVKEARAYLQELLG